MASDSEEIEYQAIGGRNQYKPFHIQENTGLNEEEDDDSEISLQEERGFLVHMSPDVNRSQWNHVDDLDKFFTSVYEYHQRHGFETMVLAETLQLLQFVFIVLFVTYLNWCVNYEELFDNVHHNSTKEKITFSDVTYPVGTCIARFNFLTWFLLFLCLLLFIGKSIQMVINFSNYLRTRNFFISALNIETRDLSNMTWHEVQLRLLEVQKEQQICIHKQELTQLDIYHRILRFKNYLVAMVNKDLLPLKFRLPCIGQHSVLTHGMRFNLDVLLYWSPWSIFINSYTMREEYKNHHKKKQLADQLSAHITILALLNLLLSPFIFFYQLLYFFFRYADIVKRSPSFLGTRQWANYGRLYLRHFNELDHELNARLSRAYMPSKMYMNSFNSACLIVLAKYIAFFACAPAAVLFVLGILDFRDVTRVEHLVTVASISGILATICSSFVADENEVFCPERLMMSILAQIHYMPDNWKGRAHTSHVRDEFAMLFQYKLVYIIEELLSPIVTPFWLFFCLRRKSAQIVDFFRCFTVDVAGVGDVCSFAQMDIKKHGSPQWTQTKPPAEVAPRAMQAENGKIELSLMHFTTTNPEWKPPEESNAFIAGVKHEVQRELPALTSIVADPFSLPSLGYVNPVPPLFPMSSSIQRSSHPSTDQTSSMSPLSGYSAKLRGGLSNHDGPISQNSNFQTSLTTSGSFHTANFALSTMDEGQHELLSGNMSLSVLHMHEVHHRKRCAPVWGARALDTT
jgi:autophagy-related protein 9